jgi:uncharacterized protein with GYD domain
VATHVVLMNWTDQGIKTFQQSPSRADVGREEMEKLGITLKDIYWTIGPYDLVLTVDAPDEEALAAALLRIGSAGNIRTTTLRAFSRDEFDRVAELVVGA